jgi:uncharacterized membrane protein YbhN (UPF0104 family)
LLIVSSRLIRLGVRYRGCARLLVGALATTAVVVVSLHAGPLARQAIGDAGSARPSWVVVAGAGFLTAVLASAAAWRAALRRCNGTIGLVDTASRYAVGSLVNTFVPARLGDAVRISLLSRAFESRDRLLTTAGVFFYLGLARVAVLTLVLLGAVAWGLLPAELLVVPVGVLVLAGVLVSRADRCSPRLSAGRLSALASARSAAPSLEALSWLVVSTLARVAAAAASAAALGVPNPLAAAAIIVPVLEVATLVPVTPGNVGITSAAVALALKAQDIGMSNALAVGLVFHAVETIVGISFGIAGTLFLVGSRSPLVPRVAAVAGAVATLVVVGGVLGMLPDVA